MIQSPVQNNEMNNRASRSRSRKKPFGFLSNILRKKKILKFEDVLLDNEMNFRTRSEPSVSTYSCGYKSKRNKTPSSSTLSLNPDPDPQISEDIDAIRLRSKKSVQRARIGRSDGVDFSEADANS
ncbi:uncharacterized protein LOC129748042 isoform X6 [Uranotaenia lowii]|uniref:uncharacterized protein LOC129748042 isoform X6 n=1 Tax=Uranotaenia lowii TaxID=190385 RepID=UPI002478D69E|nr:uncharacterized protein LOC129748042 isoform X6 [Uranotaenia lowii]